MQYMPESDDDVCSGNFTFHLSVMGFLVVVIKLPQVPFV